MLSSRQVVALIVIQIQSETMLYEAIISLSTKLVYIIYENTLCKALEVECIYKKERAVELSGPEGSISRSIDFSAILRSRVSEVIFSLFSRSLVA